MTNPLIIAHRGASAYMPEHSREAMILGFTQGADFIEQDLVMTRDGVVIVLHDLYLDAVTDVAIRFPGRQRADGLFYALDFDWAEIQQLRMHERLNLETGQAYFAGRSDPQLISTKVQSFEASLHVLRQLNQQFDRRVGIYAELKTPWWFHEQNRDLSQAVLAVIGKFSESNLAGKILIETFDWDEVQRLKLELNWQGPMCQLLSENSWNAAPCDYDYLKSAAGLKEIRQITNCIGPHVNQLVTGEGDGLSVSQFALRAKEQGLLIQPYTFRADKVPAYAKDYGHMVSVFAHDIQVDGFVTDQPDVTRTLLSSFG